MKLIFVYNANSGKVNALVDAAHKLFSPSTYQCSLCALTYDTFSENKTWKAFRKESHLTMEFYHKDEFESLFPNVNIPYPAILKLKDSEPTTVLNTEVLNKISTVEGLIENLKTSL
jgi:hypothetical protein